ncbi:MAG: heavy-metal-associated domain-containing protein [Flavobacteriales bacterium]|nr:heavy-metal-associated domain-containing protein [Flavobacteriales bacterium]
MRTTLIILFASFSLNVAFAQKSIETVEIKTSAVCDMCKETIEKQMAFTKGVTGAMLNVKTSVLTVSYKTNRTTLEDIRTAINEVGYDADDSPATKEAYENLHDCCKKDSH